MARNYKRTIFHKSIGVCVMIVAAYFTLGSTTTIPPHSTPMALTPEMVAASNPAEWFKNPAFIRLIEIHDQYLVEFAKWRRLFARHATQLARLLKTFPGSENLSEDHLCRIISNPETKYDSLMNRNVFGPWTNRWSGVWSNGVRQHHIWDSTRVINGKSIQPVILSETRFVNFCCVEEMVQILKTDIAINVFSQDEGITGWVSKRQHGRVEVPHIGYLVNDTTLVWICQIKEPEKLFKHDTRWFVFLETVNLAVKPVEYRIYGMPIEIGETLSIEVSQRDKHCGTYYSVKSPAKALGSTNSETTEIEG